MKIDTSTGAGGYVAVARVRFDRHIDGCDICGTGRQCVPAEGLWRLVCQAAVKAAQAVK